ncbi:DMT family transporter [Aegicerativicinus sediminis]|uniref:DMT family transporter n=1 Tax=Aegicerativicinus sediminis TaxID=2893202 RepID=UPI001E54AD6F|nr:DMT family transporter [Aegicerativicinus sediminis]
MESWMSPMGYTVTRMFFGTVIFWIIGFFIKKDRFIEKKDLVTIAIGGLMGFIGTQFLFSQALEYTTPVIFSLLMALIPVVVLILSAIFLKELVSIRKVLGILISITGAAIVILFNNAQGSSGGSHLLGVLFSVLCVLCYGGYMVITRKISMKYHPLTIAKWMFLVSAVAAIPFSFGSLRDQPIYSDQADLTAYGLLAFALLFSTIIAFFLMPFALKRLEASMVSVFMNLQPIIASMIAILVGQDQFTWDKPLATLMVVFGVYMVTTNSSRHWQNKILA